MKGFSLLEIMVAVAIVSVMAVSVVIGFNSFGQTVRVRETAGVLTDTIKKLELETIRRDYLKNTIHFENNFLVVESKVENQTLSFNWEGIDTIACPEAAELRADNTGGSSTLNLAQRNAYGNNIEISNIPIGEEKIICVPFADSDEIEWQYQVFGNSQASQIIRFIHFNVRRDTAAEVKIADNDYRLEISAPYAAKKYYNNSGIVTGSVELTLEAEDLDPETVILQE